MALIGEMHYLTIGGNTYAIPTSGGSTVSVTRTLTSGTKTATISVDGTSYDLYAPTPNAGTITSVKTTAGAHTAINVSSGAANFNVPTKTSHLTNDSGFLTVAVTSISTAAGTHTPQAQAVTGDVSFNIPTKTSHLVNDSGFLTSSDIASVLRYKGTKDTVSALPTSGNTTGDVWHVTADGSEWAWDGSAWQELGTAIDLSGYAQLAGASFTGPVTFGDSVTADELETGDLVVTGAASFTNNIAANTINGVAVGSSPKFTDTVTTVTTTGDGNAITAISATNGVITATKGATYVTSSGVTSITLKAGSGITLDTDNTAITTTGTRTISHADTSSQASSSNSGRTYIQSLTLDTYGHVTGISTATETVTNTDTKLQVAEVTSSGTYYPIVGSGTTAATRQYDTTGFKYSSSSGTTSINGTASLSLGNSTASGTTGNKLGELNLYGSGSRCVSLRANVTAASDNNFTIYFPAKNGTVALTSDIPSTPTSTESATIGITASTTATKTTLGTAFTIPNVTSAGSASTWTFGATTVGDGTLVGAVDSSDTSMLVITAGTKSVQQKTGGANGSAPTLGTAFTVPNVTGNTSATVSITDNGHTHTI